MIDAPLEAASLYCGMYSEIIDSSLADFCNGRLFAPAAISTDLTEAEALEEGNFGPRLCVEFTGGRPYEPPLLKDESLSDEGLCRE